MRMKKEEFVGVGKCPVCERTIYVDETTHKIHFCCRVHPCLSKEEYHYYDRSLDDYIWEK